jgi:hypothetical protein
MAEQCHMRKATTGNRCKREATAHISLLRGGDYRLTMPPAYWENWVCDEHALWYVNSSPTYVVKQLEGARK